VVRAGEDAAAGLLQEGLAAVDGQADVPLVKLVLDRHRVGPCLSDDRNGGQGPASLNLTTCRM
jgi:hypothetical protein